MSTTNTRVGVSSNLPTGATYDLLLLGFPSGFPQGQLEFVVGDTPRKVTGLQKVVQVFLKILYTSVGSDPFYPNFGTSFPSLTYHANRIDVDSVLQAELQTAVADAASQTKSTMNTAKSDAVSQLASVDVLGIDTGNTSIAIYMKITTNAGASASISIPFPQLDLETNG